MRWPEKIIAKGETPIADLFLLNYSALGIKALEALIIIHLMQFKWDESPPYPAISTIARLTGIPEKCIRDGIRQLEKKGFLFRMRHPSGTNAYNLAPLFKKLEHLPS